MAVIEKEHEIVKGSGRLHEARTSQKNKVEVVLEDNGETTVLKNVLILGKSSRNKAEFLDDALRNGARLYEEAEVFVGHTYDGTNPTFDRSMGVIRNPVFSPGEGIRGDHAFPTKHRLREDLVWRANHCPKGIGYSHDAFCHWNVVKGKKQVYEIENVFSVDLVTRPATTGGLDRQEEENMPAEQQDFAEHGFSAVDACRTILLSDSPVESKRERLFEEIAKFHGELTEGEIGDEMAKDEPVDKMRKMHRIAHGKMDSALFDWDGKYKTHGDKRDRLMSVLKDHMKELSSLNCCDKCGGKGCAACSSSMKEELDMKPEEITVDWLRANKPELVAKLTGTDEQTRMTEELNTLRSEKASLQAEHDKRLREEEITKELETSKFPVSDTVAYSARFREELSKAADKTERAAIIRDRMTLLSGRIQEAAVGSPFEEFRDNGGQLPKRSSAYKKVFSQT